MLPTEKLTPWIADAARLMEPQKISDEDFKNLGNPHIGYIKLHFVNEEEARICVYSADGHILLQDTNLQKVLDWIMYRQLTPVPLH